MNHFILPKAVNLQALLDKMEFKRKPKAYVMKFIITSIFLGLGVKNEDPDGYVPLSSQVLKRINVSYAAYLKCLIENKIIAAKHNGEGKASYQTGSTCKRYKFCDHYDELIFEPIVNTKLISKLDSSGSLPIPMYLSCWFNNKLTVNNLAADKILKRKKKNKHQHAISIMRINKYDYFYSRDRKGMRIHSNLTSLKRCFRKYLEYNGNRLIEIDIKFSQPFIIANLILNKLFYQNPSISSTITLIDIYHMYINTRKINTSSTYSNHTTSLYHVSNFIHKISMYIDAPDVKLFKEIIETDDIYEVLMDEQLLGVKTRNGAKKIFYKIFYSKADSKSKFKRALLNYFPNVFKILDLYKQESEIFPWHNPEKPHAAIAVLLQYIESHLVVDTACKRISELYPDAPLFTIHDSVMTTREYSGYVGKILETSIEEMTGTMPMIVIKC
jgi:hypothetical protein